MTRTYKPNMQHITSDTTTGMKQERQKKSVCVPTVITLPIIDRYI